MMHLLYLLDDKVNINKKKEVISITSEKNHH